VLLDGDVEELARLLLILDQVELNPLLEVLARYLGHLLLVLLLLLELDLLLGLGQGRRGRLLTRLLPLQFLYFPQLLSVPLDVSLLELDELSLAQDLLGLLFRLLLLFSFILIALLGVCYLVFLYIGLLARSLL